MNQAVPTPNENCAPERSLVASQEMALRYIEALTGAPDTPMAFTLLDDKKRKGHKPEILYGRLSDLFARMKAKNAGGYGVFAAVNRLRADAKGNRNAKNVEALRALFTDSDEGEERAPKLEPSFAVQSARGAHRYWLLEDGEPLALFSAAQEHLAAAFDSDPRVVDLPRLMRMPGFLHQKRDPQLVTFHQGSQRHHSVAEVLKAHPVTPEELAAFRAKHRANRKARNGEARSTRDKAEPANLPPMKERKRRAERYLARLPVAVEGQGGDSQTYRAACVTVWDFAIDNVNDAMEVLRRWNASCCPPWEEEELAAKVWSALRNATGVKGGKLVRPAKRKTKALRHGATGEEVWNAFDDESGSPTAECTHDAENDDVVDQHLRGAANDNERADDHAEEEMSSRVDAPGTTAATDVDQLRASAPSGPLSVASAEQIHVLDAEDTKSIVTTASGTEGEREIAGDTPSTADVEHGAGADIDEHLPAVATHEDNANDEMYGAPTTFDSLPVVENNDNYLKFLEILANNRTDALKPEVVADLARLCREDNTTFQMCLEEARLSGPGLVGELKKAVKAKVRADSQASVTAELEEAAASVTQAVPAARAVVTDEHEVPYGYEMEPSGIVKLVEKQYKDCVELVRVPICDRPIFLTAVLEKTDGSGTLLELAFFNKVTGGWRKLTAPRHVVRTSRLINELALHDLPVHSGAANLLVEYLAAYEDHNERVLPRRTGVVQMGWHTSGKEHVFVAGHECHTPKPETEPVTFCAVSDGDEHLANCLRAQGTLAGWAEAMRLVTKHPRVELAVYAALAPPLMDVVGAPSFAIDYCGESSTGKTTTMRIAASVWGVPDERARNSFIHSWNTTQVGLERLAATLNGLPVFMDETKQAPTGPRGKCIVPECIYQMTNGKGRTRGAVEGRRKTLYWNTLLLTTGEKAAVDHSKDAGPAARLLTLWGSPFGGYSDDVAVIERLLRDNYGHAGPAFVRWLVENRPAHESEWCHTYRQLVVQLKAELAVTLDNGVADRLAKYLALLDLTARLVRQVIDVPGDASACIDAVLSDVAKGAAPFDRPLEALLHCYHVAVAEKASFFGCHDGNHPPPRFNGYWNVKQKTVNGMRQDSYEFIGFTNDFLHRTLTAGGFDVEPTTKLWEERGWLKGDKGKHRGLRVSMFGERPRVIAVTHEAIEQALNERVN